MASEIAGYVANVGMSMLFGLGYYLVKKKKTNSKDNSKEIERDTILIDSISSLTDVHLLIKEKKLECDEYKVINLILKKGFKPNIETYNLLLSKAFSSKNFSAAIKLKEEILESLTEHTTNDDNIKKDLIEAKENTSFSLFTKLKSLTKGVNSNIKNVDDQNNTLNQFSDIYPNATTLAVLIKGLGIEFSNLLYINETQKTTDEETDLPDTEVGINFDHELSQLQRLKFDKELRSIVTLFNKNKIELNLESHNNLINSLIETNRIEEAWNHYRYLLSLRSKSKNTNNNTNDASNILEPNCFTYLTLIKGIKRIKNNNVKKAFISKAKAFFKECDHLSHYSQYPYIFLSLFDMLVKNAIFSATNSEEEIKEIENLLYQNTDKFVKLEYLENAFCSVINGYSRLKDLNSAMRVFENLKKQFEKRVLSIKEKIININNKSNLNKFFESELKNNNENDNNAYNKEEFFNETSYISSLFPKQNNSQDLIDNNNYNNNIRQENENPALKLTAYSYSAILNTCSRTKNMDIAELLLEEMNKNKIKYNQYIFAIIINGYKKTNNYQKALQLYLKIRENSFDINKDEQLKLSTVIFNSILDCCISNNEFEQMQFIFNYLADLSNTSNFLPEKCSLSSSLSQKTRIKKDIVPDLISYSILIKGYAKANNLEKVLEVYNYLKDNFEVDEVLFNTLLDAFVFNNNEIAFNRVLKEMRDAGIKPSVVTYGIIMKLYVYQGDLDKCSKTFYDMIDNHVSPNIIIYQLLIKINSKKGNYNECLALYKKLSDSDVKPDCLLTDFLVDLFCKGFQVEEATQVCEIALNGYTEELRKQINVFKKSLGGKHISSNTTDSENLNFIGHIISDVENKNATNDDGNDKANAEYHFNFDNNSTSGMLDLGTIEFFVWGVIEEKDLIYLDKKLIVERLYKKIQCLYELIKPFVIQDSINSSNINNNKYKSKYNKTIYNTPADFDDTKTLSSVITTTMNNTSNLSFKLVNLVIKLKKDIEVFLNDSAYNHNNNYNRNRNNHYINNTNYQERVVNTSKRNYNNNNNNYNNKKVNNFNKFNNYSNSKCYEKINQEEEFFNADEQLLEFDDTASQATFKSHFRIKPCANYFQKKQENGYFVNNKNDNAGVDVELLFENDDLINVVNHTSTSKNKQLNMNNINDDLKSEIGFDDNRSLIDTNNYYTRKNNNNSNNIDYYNKNKYNNKYDNNRINSYNNPQACNNYNKNNQNNTFNQCNKRANTKCNNTTSYNNNPNIKPKTTIYSGATKSIYA